MDTSLKAKDIARMAGVSPATVSIVVNNRHGVSDATRARILQLIQELGCEHLLQKSETHGNLGFLVYRRVGSIVSESPFYALFMDSVSTQAMERGYGLMHLHLSHQMTLQEQTRIVQSSHCHGLIVFSAEMQLEDLQRLKAIGLPFVILDNRFIESACNAVCINNYEGIFLAVQHLVELGHTEIGYINSTDYINSFQERMLAYRSAMAYFGLPVRDENILYLNYLEQKGISDMKALVRGRDRMPTGLVSANDLLALSALRGLQECGYQIPRDISVVGFDGRPTCLYSDPPLTTIDVPTESFAPAGLEILMDSMAGDDRHKTVLIGTKLIVRESTTIPLAK